MFFLRRRNKGFGTRHRLSESYQKRLIKFALCCLYTVVQWRARSGQLVVFDAIVSEHGLLSD